MNCVLRKLVLGFWIKSDTNWFVHFQKKNLEALFCIEEEDELYYLWNKNQGTDQLCSYCTADLCLCSCIHAVHMINENIVYAYRWETTYLCWKTTLIPADSQRSRHPSSSVED